MATIVGSVQKFFQQQPELFLEADQDTVNQIADFFSIVGMELGMDRALENEGSTKKKFEWFLQISRGREILLDKRPIQNAVEFYYAWALYCHSAVDEKEDGAQRLNLNFQLSVLHKYEGDIEKAAAIVANYFRNFTNREILLDKRANRLLELIFQTDRLKKIFKIEQLTYPADAKRALIQIKQFQRMGYDIKTCKEKIRYGTPEEKNEARARLFINYTHGITVPKDFVEANYVKIENFDRIRTYFRFNEGWGEVNNSEQARLLRESAKKGDAWALYNLGLVYYNGLNGEKVDKSLAFENFQAAYWLGVLPAYERLAECYQYGRGYPADLTQAAKILRELQKKIDRDAHINTRILAAATILKNLAKEDFSLQYEVAEILGDWSKVRVLKAKDPATWVKLCVNDEILQDDRWKRTWLSSEIWNLDTVKNSILDLDEAVVTQIKALFSEPKDPPEEKKDDDQLAMPEPLQFVLHLRQLVASRTPINTAKEFIEIVGIYVAKGQRQQMHGGLFSKTMMSTAVFLLSGMQEGQKDLNSLAGYISNFFQLEPKGLPAQRTFAEKLLQLIGQCPILRAEFKISDKCDFSKPADLQYALAHIKGYLRSIGQRQVGEPILAAAPPNRQLQ